MATWPGFCPRCDDPRLGRFCEQCGYAYSTDESPGWYAAFAPDRDYFEMAGEATRAFTFPALIQPRRVRLVGSLMRIGRHSRSRAITPEIDLALPPADPCVSRGHARLLAQPEGRWAVVDDGSENGTYLNGCRTPIPARHLIPLADGDRLHLGIWTTITLYRGG